MAVEKHLLEKCCGLLFVPENLRIGQLNTLDCIIFLGLLLLCSGAFFLALLLPSFILLCFECNLIVWLLQQDCIFLSVLSFVQPLERESRNLLASPSLLGWSQSGKLSVCATRYFYQQRFEWSWYIGLIVRWYKCILWLFEGLFYVSLSFLISDGKFMLRIFQTCT